MPASSRLVQKLKETWGDEVTQDLVTWVDEAQSVHRAELRELNERMVAFDAKLDRVDAAVVRLDERLTLSVARLDERIGVSQARLNERIALSEARFEAKLNERVGICEARLEAKLDERIKGVYSKLDERINGVRLEIAHLQGRTDTAAATLRADLATQLRDQMKWMFVFWIGTLLPLATLIVALGKGWF